MRNGINLVVHVPYWHVYPYGLVEVIEISYPYLNYINEIIVKGFRKFLYASVRIRTIYVCFFGAAALPPMILDLKSVEIFSASVRFEHSLSNFLHPVKSKL